MGQGSRAWSAVVSTATSLEYANERVNVLTAASVANSRFDRCKLITERRWPRPRASRDTEDFFLISILLTRRQVTEGKRSIDSRT